MHENNKTSIIINELIECDQWDAIDHIQELLRNDSELQSRIEELEKDAARYRWLKRSAAEFFSCVTDATGRWCEDEEKADMHIDAARKGEK